MFAGIIETTGVVAAIRPATGAESPGGKATRLEVRAGGLFDELKFGASVAVNGVCLTLATRHGEVGGFDVIPETWQRSSLATLPVGAPVNLERSLRLGDRIDGHFVQGHVDAVGTVDDIDTTGGEWKLWVAADADAMRFMIPKGSVALDGISLTIAEVQKQRFAVAVIPTTLRETNLQYRQAGDRINIETDIVARTIVHRLDQQATDAGGVSWDQLREAGFTA
jgi:riboflavin synthase